jgi:hypothetical protein
VGPGAAATGLAAAAAAGEGLAAGLAIGLATGEGLATGLAIGLATGDVAGEAAGADTGDGLVAGEAAAGFAAGGVTVGAGGAPAWHPATRSAPATIPNTSDGNLLMKPLLLSCSCVTLQPYGGDPSQRSV